MQIYDRHSWREVRKARGIKVPELAEALGVAEGTVWRWECGLRVPDLYTIVRMAKILEINIREIVREAKGPSAKEAILIAEALI